MLLEAGFDVVSSDASDKMLKTAYEERWRRRKEPAFDKWSRYPQTLSVSSYLEHFQDF